MKMKEFLGRAEIERFDACGNPMQFDLTQAVDKAVDEFPWRGNERGIGPRWRIEQTQTVAISPPTNEELDDENAER